jgi:dipeptidyl aminopeptidase/acylaminoacyl peptidase
MLKSIISISYRKTSCNYKGIYMKLLLAVFLSVCCCFSQANSNIDIFGRLPFVKDVQISPDGKKIAYLRDMDGKYVVVTQVLSGGKPSVFGMKKAQIRGFTWANNEHILLNLTIPYYSKGDFETFTMYRLGVLDVKLNDVKWIFRHNRFKSNISGPELVNKLPNDKEHVLLSYYYGQMNALYKVKLKDGSREEVFSTPRSQNWLTNDDGNVFLYRHYTGSKNKWINLYRDNLKDDFEQLSILKDGKLANFNNVVVKLSKDKKTLYYWERNKENRRILVKSSLDKLIVSHAITVSENTNYDFDSVVYDYNNTKMVGTRIIEDYPEYDYFDNDLAQVQADLKATYLDAEIYITSYDLKRERMVIKISGDSFPEKYIIYDRKLGQLQPVAEGYLIKEKSTLGKVDKFDFVASDGEKITSYLTLPIMKEGKKPPLIVMPHGGPEDRDNMSFDWMRQFFAAEGFAVFQPNYRGSSGFGSDFVKSGHGQWGKAMQRDIDEGVELLITKGKVDPDKICVVGASYGGYVAMFSATQRQTVYKCSVSFAGISNLGDIFLHEKEQLNFSNYFTKSIGKPGNYKLLHQYSPYHLASKETLPLLLIHGNKDTQVPVFQSKKMHKRLKKFGNENSKYIEIDDEDHWLSSGDSRRIFLDESLKFINKHI